MKVGDVVYILPDASAKSVDQETTLRGKAVKVLVIAPDDNYNLSIKIERPDGIGWWIMPEAIGEPVPYGAVVGKIAVMRKRFENRKGN